MNKELIKYGIGIVHDIAPMNARAQQAQALSFGCVLPIVSQEEELHPSTTMRAAEHPLFSLALNSSVNQLDITKSGTISLPISDGQGVLHIIVRAGVDVVIKETFVAKEYTGVVVQLFVEAGARVRYETMQTLSTDAFAAMQYHAYVMRDATLDWVSVQLGGNQVLSHIYTNLVEPGATGNTIGIGYAAQKQWHDLYAATIHTASNTTSNMLTKIVLDDDAHTIYRGLVEVAHGAAGCEGYQQEDTLMLSSTAAIDSVPDLMIANNDVKCSHGVTTTRLNAEKLFYMKSRGMTEREASLLAVRAHLSSALVETSLDQEAQEQVLDMIISAKQS
jgi:Fe-S cluster assembly scaffold protein SufB